MASQALNAQLVLGRQIAHLAGDDVFDQEEVYPQLVPVKVPDLKAFSDERDRKRYVARLQAYDIISKTFSKFKAESISDAQQSTYLLALKRELGPFLSNSLKRQIATENTASQPSTLYNLQQYLARIALDSLAQVMRSNLGVQFTRRHIGQIIRLLTNLIFQSESKQLVLMSIWVFSFWNFDVETVPMGSRALETLDRTEETNLTNQGWIPLWACSNWKEECVKESKTAFSSVSYSWMEPQLSLAAQTEVVLKGKTSARLVALVDALTYVLANPEKHNYMSIRYEALVALQRLIRMIPAPMMDLQGRWLHSLYPALFDAELGPEKQEIAYNILIEASQYLCTQPTHASSSHILLNCLAKSANKGSSAADPPYYFEKQLEAGFRSSDTKIVLKMISIWGPLLLILGDGIFQHNLINVMLELLRNIFTHLEPSIRTLSFKAWSFLIIAFARTSNGVRIWKRLKLLHLPIVRAYSQEDNYAVLHAAFDCQVQLMSSVKAHMATDWQVILAQALSFLLKNPVAHKRVATDDHSINTQSSSSSSSLPGTSQHPSEISIIDRCCLFIGHLLQNKDVSGSVSLTTHFSPFESLKLIPYVPQPPSTKDPKRWNMDVTSMELQMHIDIEKNAKEEKADQKGPISLPSLTGTASSHSFLSLTMCMILRCLNPENAPGDDTNQKQSQIDLSLARYLWSSLCINLSEHFHQNGLHGEQLVRGVQITAPNILAWSLTFLSAAASMANNRRLWDMFIEDAVKIATRVHNALCHSIPNPHHNSSERTSTTNPQFSGHFSSTFAQYCHWIIGPKCFEYSTEEKNSPESLSRSDTSSVLSVATFFGLEDLVGNCFEHLQLDHPPSFAVLPNWSRQSQADRVSEFSQSFKHYTSIILRNFAETLPKSGGGVLENVLHILRPIPLQLQQHVYPGLQNLSHDVLASQNDSSELAELLFRLNISFSVSVLLSDCVRDTVQNTAHIYPQHLYHTTSHHSSPSKSSKSKNGSVQSSPTSKKPVVPPNTVNMPTSSSMDGIVEFDGTGTVVGRTSTTLHPTTFPSSHSLAVMGDIPSSSGKSSGSNFSNMTTTTSGGSNAFAISSGTSSSSDLEIASETRHPRVLLREILECIVYPLQLAKRLLSIISPLNDETQPGSPSLSSSLLRNVFTRELHKELKSSMISLLQIVARIAQNRCANLVPLNRNYGSHESASGSTANMSIILYINLVHLLHQLRDMTTFRQLDRTDSSQISQQSVSSSRVGKTMQHIRLWYLHTWNSVFEVVLEGLTSSSIFKHRSTPEEQLWAFKDTIATFTQDLSSHSADSSTLLKELTSTVQTWNTPRTKPESALSLSPYLKEDLESLFELSVPDWRIIMPENSRQDLKSSSSSSSSSMSSTTFENSMSHLEFAAFSSIPHPDDTGDEKTMSAWSKFYRRILCCLGMVWRSSLMLVKGGAKSSTPDGPSSFPQVEPWIQSSEAIQAVSTSVLASALLLVEKWDHGHNLLVDLLPVMCWALASDTAAAKIRSAVPLSPILKKQMENVSGATLACITRSFSALSRLNESFTSTQRSNQVSGPKLSLVPSTPAIHALLNRSASVLLVMFESKRSVIRNQAWKTWSYSFGLVQGLTCSNKALTSLIYDLNQSHPNEVALADPVTWKNGSEISTSKSGVKAPKPSGNSSKMDIDDPTVVLNGEKATTKSEPVEHQTPTIPAPATLFPMDVSHKRETKFGDSLEQSPDIVAEAVGQTMAAAFRPKKAPAMSSPVATTALNATTAVLSPSSSPNKVKLGVSNNSSFVPRKSSPSATTPPDASTNVLDPNARIPSNSSSAKNNPKKESQTDSASTVALPLPLAASSGTMASKGSTKETKIPSKNYTEWNEALDLVTKSAARVLEDPNITISQLIEAQQLALQLATVISKRIAKG